MEDINFAVSFKGWFGTFVISFKDWDNVICPLVFFYPVL
jgi:hypothetical protein